MATIGIDVTALSNPSPGGIGTSQYETLRALAELESPHRFVMYAALQPLVPYSDRPLDLPFELRLGTGITTRSNILWMQTGINRILAQDSVDVFWSPRHLLPFRAAGIATVGTVQDFWHLHYPEQQPFANRIANRLLIGKILREATRIVTTSQATADDAIGHYGIDPGRIDVVPLGVDAARYSPARPDHVATVLERLGVSGDYLLAMDVYNPRKNVRVIVEALAVLPAELLGRLTLVALGKPRATSSGLDVGAIASSLGVASSVRLVGDTSPEDLLALYSGAFAFVYPSVYEGFGMPVLEAMGCGSPVITANRSSLPEVAGDAGLLVDPDDPVAVAGAIERLVTDSELRSRLISAGRERAATFTWRRTAEGMLQSMEAAYATARGASRD